MERPKRVEMEEGAEEAAYAEKPFQDALVDYRDSLDDGGRKALEFVASREGEKALTKYQAGKKESPQISILREQVLKTLVVPRDVKVYVEQRPKDIADPAWIEKWQYGLREMGKQTVEDILAGNAEVAQKAKLLERIGPEMAEGIRRFATGKEVGQISGMSGNIARGEFVGALMAGDFFRTDRAMTEVAFQEKRTMTEFIRKNLGFLQAARISYPEVGRALDRAMKEKGWLWDEQEKKYIEFS